MTSKRQFAVMMLLLATCCTSGVVRAQGLSAGAARAPIAVPADVLPLDAFSTVRDTLQARALVVGDGTTRAVLLVVDLTSISGDDVEKMKALAAKATGAPIANVLVVASHTFSAPHVIPAQFVKPDTPPSERAKTAAWEQAILAAAQEAAETAGQVVRPVQLAFSAGVSDVNVNRDLPTPVGWWLGANAAGFSDKTLQVITFADRAGAPVALIVDFPVQSSILNESITSSGGRAISADLQGAAMSQVEARDAGAVSLFLTGAAGDQAPILAANSYIVGRDGQPGRYDVGEKGYVLVDLLGRRLGADALRVSKDAALQTAAATVQVVTRSVRLQQQTRPKDIHQIRPNRAYDFKAQGEVDTPFTLLRMGDVVIVGVQAELSSADGERIRRQSPFPHTMVATMVNGAAKYMPSQESYDRITYEAMNSDFAKGSAEIFIARILDALRALKSATPVR